MTTWLHERFPALAETLPHLVLSERPTPVRELKHFGVWVKEDGRFGSGGWGGNKVRKLEWLIPEAKRRDRRSILTFGGLGTNWGLATALYAREHGLETALALVDQPIDDHVRAQLARLEASGEHSTTRNCDAASAASISTARSSPADKSCWSRKIGVSRRGTTPCAVSLPARAPGTRNFSSSR